MAQDLCYYCMTPTLAGGRCTACGRPAVATGKDTDILPPGTSLLNGRIILGNKLGRGGFGITYVGLDTKTGKRVAVKEFMPRYLASRSQKSLFVEDEKRETYERVLRSFHKEANTIHLLDSHPNIVRVLLLFDENDTAYYTMEMLHGQDLHKYLLALGRPLSPEEAYVLLEPIMQALSFVHQKGVLHRDISPDNILLCTETAQEKPPEPGAIQHVKLIDFGAAHVAVESFTQSYPEVRKNGYSPLEQNWDGDKQGPWTDEYAFAATFYTALTGKSPTPARDRTLEQDPLLPPSAFVPRIPKAVDQVILSGMTLRPKDRYQDIDTLRRELYKAIYHKSIPEPKPKPDPEPDPHSKKDTFLTPEAKNAARSLTMRRLMALLLDVLVFCGLPSILLSGSGLLLGWLLMLIINSGLVFSYPFATLGERFLKLSVRSETPGGVTIAQSLIRNLVRGIVPLSLMENIVMFFGRYRPAEDRWSHTAVVDALAAGQPVDGMESQPSMASQVSKVSEVSQAARPIPSAPKGRLTLVCVAGSMKDQRLEYREPMLLGRDPKRANILIPAEDRQASGLHASIRQNGGAYLLRDEHSSNGTRLNGTRINADGDAIALRDGDAIEIGAEKFMVSKL